MPTGEAAIFNMDGLMRVMGKDPKGRAAMFKMVRGAIGGREPLDQAAVALQEGRLRDAARAFHSLRGAVGVLGARLDPGHHGGRKRHPRPARRSSTSSTATSAASWNKPWPRPAPGWNASNPDSSLLLF
jgi:hypothetical protein